MSEKRSVTVEDLGVGFAVTCDTCPVITVLRALGLPVMHCAQGIFTNMQGAVPTGTCRFCEDMEDGPLVVCGYKEADLA